MLHRSVRVPAAVLFLVAIGLPILSARAFDAATASRKIPFAMPHEPLREGIWPVADRPEEACGEEFQLLASVMRDGVGSRPSLEALRRIARCDAVRNAIAAILTAAPATPPDRKHDQTGDVDTTKGEAKRPSLNVTPGGSAARPDAADKGKRSSGADTLQSVPPSAKADEGRGAEKKAAPDVGIKRPVEKKAKAEVPKSDRRKTAGSETSGSRLVTHAKCEALVRAKYLHFSHRYERDQRVGQCLATSGSHY